MREHPQELKHIVETTPWLMAVLRVVREAGPREAYVAAGAVRDTVWNRLTGRAEGGPAGDIDVVYFDASEQPGASKAYEAALARHLPSVRWEATNQAWVHLWHAEVTGQALLPHQSLAEGMATWPETATAVGVRLAARGDLDVIAPFGLRDLFELIVRHNPVRASDEVYRERLEAKQWCRRWPELKVLQPSGGA